MTDLSLKRGIDKSVCSGWKQYILNLVENKITQLKNKIKPNKVTSVLQNNTVKENLNKLQSKFVLVPIDKAANNVAFICKQFYASVIVNELGYNNITDNQNNLNNTYQLINNTTKTEIIDAHKSFLSKYKVEINKKMERLPSMYWLPKMHKQPVGFRFIIASPKCSLKPLTKQITSIFKLVYNNVERYNLKSKIWSGVNKFWIIQNNKPVINTINKINKRHSAKHFSTFDFSTLYTKIPHNKLLEVLNEIIDFSFKGGTRDKITVTSSGAYWTKETTNSKGTVYSKNSIKSALKYILDNCFFEVGNLIFQQKIGIPMGSDPAPFFANLFLYNYESKWLHKLKNQQYHKARKFSNVFRFIDDLIAINDGHEFLNSYHEIYPQELVLKKENVSDLEATFLDLHLQIENEKISTKLYDKRNNYNFHIVRFPHKSSNIPSKMFYSTIGAEILRICRTTTEFQNFVSATTSIISRMFKQGAEKIGLSNVINKMLCRHDHEFNKYNKTPREILEILIS